MKLETLKEKLGEWFWPSENARMTDLMTEIHEASQEFKKDMNKALAKQIVSYHYCAQYGLKIVSGFVSVHTHTEYDPLKDVRKYNAAELYQSVMESIAWQNSFDIKKMVVLSLSPFN